MKITNRIISDITDFVFVSDTPCKVNAIFLPGGSCPEPPEYAAKLYHEGFAPRLLPSGGVSVKSGKFNGVKSKADIYDRDYQTDCAFYTDVLLKNGVPESAVICEDKSGHTHDNAFFSRKIIDEHSLKIKRAIIVCKSFHARRCLMLYQLAFPDTELFICPVDCFGITKDNWFMFEYGIDRVLGELSRCGNQFVGDIKEYLK